MVRPVTNDDIGLKVLREAPAEAAQAIDIVAIHGIGAYPDDTWCKNVGTAGSPRWVNWLSEEDMLPAVAPNARIMRYGYQSQWFGEGAMRQTASTLAQRLLLALQRKRKLGVPISPADLYSALLRWPGRAEDEWPGIFDSTTGLLFFGTPFRGAEGMSQMEMLEAARREYHEDEVQTDVLKILEPGNEFLQEVVDQFWKTRRQANKAEVACFYELKLSNVGKIVGKQDRTRFVVSESSGCLDLSDGTSKFSLSRTHFDMNKFGKPTEEDFETVRDVVEKMIGVSRGLVLARPQSKDCIKAVPSSLLNASAPLSERNIDCLRSLSFPEQEQRYKRIETAKNTCQWLLEDPEYRAWVNKSRGLLWIKGNPGAGKSVLMKFAVTKMRRRQSGELVLSFFIHGQGTNLQKTSLGIYRALLNSMLKYFPKYLSQLTRMFEDQEERLGAYTAKRWEWIDKELQDFLSDVLTTGSKDQPVVIFIDALDECGEEVAKSLLTYFKCLMEDVESEESQVKICVSSRHYPILGVDTTPTIAVEKRNRKDIRSVVRKRLKEIGPEWKRNQIQEAILSKAQGGFQWAVLVTALVIDGNATGKRVERLHEMITSMPQALDNLYANILSEFTEAKEDQMVKLFQWVLFAERPLSMQELREALSTDKDMTVTTVSEVRRHESWTETLFQFERHVKHISRGLVEFQTRDVYEQYEPGGEESDREAQFIHQSVADYLREIFFKNVKSHRHIARSCVGAGHFEISRSCLRYLALKEVLEAIELPRGTLSARFPLVPYATRFVFEHVRKVEQQGIPQPDLLMLFQWDVRSESLGKVARLWTVVDPHRVHTPIGWPFIGTTTLHVLIALGSKSALDTFLLETDVNVRSVTEI
ncbi:hypothetical protein K469DRAFT_691138 [Zopfia rhizophila CBS 207.26]|uniref:Nephrocystin 3-like N-terminal domain-containing protein n=1 Tax=Zopfia rhizophila CBS 207.26 TaxID=1314779 RepID=A0A6A6ES76_9PEZI|nr:hypothetical protein K469DRAFT_691138 [Zopfia rhizophila CBS 207.26]